MNAMWAAAIIIVVYFAITGIVWAVLGWRHRLKAPTPGRPVRRPGAAVRLAEALVLALLGAGLLAMFLAAGYVRLNELKLVAEQRPELYRAWLTALALSAGGLVVIFAVAAAWRTSAAALLMIPWLVGSAFCLGGGRDGLAALMASPPDRVALLTLVPDPDFPRVQLYVNDVHLGEAPVTMTMEEFFAKVPDWSEPPDGLTENELLMPSQQKVERPWLRFETPRYMESWHPMKRAERRDYYAQAELDGEWATGSIGGGGGGGSGLVHAYEVGASFRFPKFDARVREHLRKARDGGTVDAQWMATAESFGNRGWQILREMISKDIRWQQVLDQWARLHYHLDADMDAEAARRTLESIAAEAEERGGYSTYSVAGAAVDLVAPHLDVGWLVRAANDAVRRGDAGYSLSRGHNGFSTRRSRGGSNRPMRDYVLAHAVLRTLQRLRALDDSRPNVIQTEVLPTLVYCSRDEGEHNMWLDLATQGGWPGAFDFVYRHNWSRQVFNWTDPDAVRVGQDQFVNGWLLRLLKFDTPEGREFRTKHSYYAFDVATKAVRGVHANVEMDQLSFLFLDPDLGTESLAVEFWPRFVELSRVIRPDHGIWGLRSRAQYLARTEPNATPEMYREALAATRGEVGWVPVEGLEELPPERQIEIIDIWIAQLREIAANPPESPQPWMDPEKTNGPLGLIGQLEMKQKDLRRQKKP